MNCPKCNGVVNAEDKFCPYCGNNLSVILVTADTLQIGTMLKDRYKIESILEEQSSQILYRAQDITLQMKVTVNEFYPKGYVIRESSVSPQVKACNDADSVRISQWQGSFLEDARNRAKVSGLPGIADVKDFFEQNGTAYIITEWLNGDDLYGFINKYGYTKPNDPQNGLSKRLTVDTAKQIMEPVMRSLIKMHEMGNIHSSICFEGMKFNNNNNLKIFGSSWDIDAGDVSDKTITLKMTYAPEECFRKAGKRGPWTDVYSVCAVLYKCITGIEPVEAGERINNDTLKRPSELGVEINPYDESALMMGLAVYADNRFADMNALYKAFYSVKNTPNNATPNSAMPNNTATNRQSVNNAVPKKKSKALVIIIVVIAIIAILAGVVFLGIRYLPNLLSESPRSEREMDSTGEDTDETSEDETGGDDELGEEDELNEYELEALEAIKEQAKQDPGVANQKDVLEQYLSFAIDNDAAEYVSEDIADAFKTYQEGVLEHVELLEGQDVIPALYIQMDIELNEALDLAGRIDEQDIEIDYEDLADKSGTLRTDYKQRLIDNFDSKALEGINSNGVISRSVLWAAMENADQTGLYDENDYEDPLRLRYIVALTYHIDSELDRLDSEQAVALIYDSLESTDYSPLLLYYLVVYTGDEYVWDYYLEDEDFYDMTLNDLRNFMYFYYTDESYASLREEIRTSMKELFAPT